MCWEASVETGFPKKAWLPGEGYLVMFSKMALFCFTGNCGRITNRYRWQSRRIYLSLWMIEWDFHLSKFYHWACWIGCYNYSPQTTSDQHPCSSLWPDPLQKVFVTSKVRHVFFVLTANVWKDERVLQQPFPWYEKPTLRVGSQIWQLAMFDFCEDLLCAKYDGKTEAYVGFLLFFWMHHF